MSQTFTGDKYMIICDMCKATKKEKEIFHYAVNLVIPDPEESDETIDQLGIDLCLDCKEKFIPFVEKFIMNHSSITGET